MLVCILDGVKECLQFLANNSFFAKASEKNAIFGLLICIAFVVSLSFHASFNRSVLFAMKSRFGFAGFVQMFLAAKQKRLQLNIGTFQSKQTTSQTDMRTLIWRPEAKISS